MDLFEKCYRFTRADELIARDMYPYFPPIEEVKGNMVSATHSDQGLDSVLGSFEKCGRQMGIL